MEAAADDYAQVLMKKEFYNNKMLRGRRGKSIAESDKFTN